jgi:UMF1 family MFS transporter
MPERPLLNRKVLAWAFYDWANSAFALSVLAALFPLFLGSYWSAGDPGASVTARLAWISAAAGAVVCIISPVFGTIADSGGYRKRFLLLLALLGALGTSSLAVVGEGNWQLALAIYMTASVGFYSSIIFYDSLLMDVTEPRYYGYVSSLGFSLGYLGGAVLLGLHVWMLLSPGTFGLSGSTEVIRYAFVSVGAWWALFMAPLFLFVPERRSALATSSHVVRAAYRELKATILKIGAYRNVVIFLIAYWFYIAGVFTMIVMAANYGQRLGFSDQDLVTALLITNFAGFPATLLYGFFSHRYGPKRGIYFALCVYVSVSIWAIYMVEVRQFYVMAIVVGCVQGGVQGLSLSLYASIIPPDQPGEFFGFYNMVTNLARVLGPLLVGIAATVSDDPKWVLLALLPLFVGGGVLLSVVREKQARSATAH